MTGNDLPPFSNSFIEEACLPTAEKSQQDAPVLVLYMRKSCPYCQRVLDYLAQEEKKISLLDADEMPGTVEELVRIGGKQQFPCLLINGKALYESLEIIAWLEKNKDHY